MSINSPIRVGITGASGRMGRAVETAVVESADTKVGALFLRAGHEQLGGKSMISECTYMTAESERLVEKVDIVIDFSLPENALNMVKLCENAGVPIVIGTTGFNKEQEAELQVASQKIPLLFSANMSVGVNATYALLRKAAELLGTEWDIELTEAHHKHKRDTPSGTALAMAKEIATTLNWDPDEAFNTDRATEQCERKPHQIGFSVIRAGDIVGEHSVLFAGKHERITIGHKAHSRSVFAEGSVVAAKYLVGQGVGFYTMKEVLGL
ncbi:MAG: 4-hydroxy-tetrahydrodipicolinate reductase [Pseudomonadota bacterium]